MGNQKLHFEIYKLFGLKGIFHVLTCRISDNLLFHRIFDTFRIFSELQKYLESISKIRWNNRLSEIMHVQGSKIPFKPNNLYIFKIKIFDSKNPKTWFRACTPEESLKNLLWLAVGKRFFVWTKWKSWWCCVMFSYSPKVTPSIQNGALWEICVVEIVVKRE